MQTLQVLDVQDEHVAVSTFLTRLLDEAERSVEGRTENIEISRSSGAHHSRTRQARGRAHYSYD